MGERLTQGDIDKIKKEIHGGGGGEQPLCV